MANKSLIIPFLTSHLTGDEDHDDAVHKAIEQLYSANNETGDPAENVNAQEATSGSAVPYSSDYINTASQENMANSALANPGLSDANPELFGGQSNSPTDYAADTDGASPLQRMLAAGGKPAGNDDVSDLITKLVSKPKADYSAQLQAALNQRDNSQLIGGLGKAANTIIGGLSHTAPSNEIYNDIEKQASQPVTDIQQQIGMADETEKRDADSDVSKLYRTTLQKMGIAIPDTASAASLEKAFPAIEKYFQAKAIRDSKVQQAQALQETHTTDKQNKAYTQAYKDMQSFRGNRSVQNAAEALRNSDQAMAIINSQSDLNNINPQQYNFLVAEMSKIAQGGAATESSIHDVKASTAQSKAAEFWQKVSGKPTPAQLGAFIQQNKEYLQHLNDINHRYVDEYHNNILKGYKSSLSSDQYDALKSDPELFPSRQSNNKITVSNGKETYQIDPKDLEHAKADGFKQVQ